MTREYYGVRTGKESGHIEISFDELKRLFISAYERFEGSGFFAQALGQHCVDEGTTVGTMGSDIELFFFLKLKKRGLWPIVQNLDQYSEHDLFSVIELLYDYVSKPLYQKYHAWDNCGYHYANFAADDGKAEFRAEINEILRCYTKKYELSENGEVLNVPDSGLEDLLEDSLRELEPDSVEKKVESAINKFRRFSSSPDDRKEAVRMLADVLEYLRPRLKDVISSKDESDLFNIANNFAIRHHNPQQKGNYDPDIWFKWIFYTYLATIHVVLGMLARRDP